MPITIMGRDATADDIPLKVSAPIIHTKKLWEDDWKINPQLELVRGVATASGHDLGSCELQRKYGPGVKSPHEADLSVRTPIDLMDHWVWIEMVGEMGMEHAWIGRVSSEPRAVYASGATPTGVQNWVAYEPLQMLRKIHVSESIWLRDGAAQRIGWVPAMNARDERNVGVGNRSASKLSGTYLYGGTGLWTHYDYLEYVLGRFVDEDAYDGPVWKISGQVDLLKAITDTVRFSSSQTVAQILRLLIPTSLGIDYTIVPFFVSPEEDSGFEVRIFALQSEERSFGGATLPKNPNTMRINPAQFSEGMQIDVVDTLDQQYDRINVLGGRIVCCCSLWGAKAPPLEGPPPPGGLPPPTLVPKWSSTLETKYKNGTGLSEDGADEHDEARKRDLLDPVYQHFGAPDDWDHNGGDAAPLVDDEGQFLDGVADYQNRMRDTLGSLPLRAGVDYTTVPFTDYSPGNHEARPLANAAYIYDTEAEGGPRYVRAEEAGVRVESAEMDWGVVLRPSVNHLLAAGGDFDDAEDSNVEPVYDHEQIVATIAFETDQQLRLHYELVSGTSPIGNVLNIEVPDAQLWYLAPMTVVDVNPDGTLKLAFNPDSPTSKIVVRNDAARLAMVMAGAIARYNMQRARATIRMKGLLPWPHLIGQILTVIEQGTDTQFIQAPITSVEWQGGRDPITTVRTGFAR